jgi:hypothetical protein
MGSTHAMAFSKIVNAACERNRHPAKPAVGDNVFIKHGLTEATWEKAIEACWKHDPHSHHGEIFSVPTAGENATKRVMDSGGRSYYPDPAALNRLDG